MPKLTRFQATFDAGELSPLLHARNDLAAYHKAAKKMENCYAMVQGPVTKRRGTLYIGALYHEAQKARLIPFTFDATRSFMLVLNGGKLQILKNFEFIESSPGTRASFPIPYTESQLSQVRYAQVGNTMVLVHPSHPPIRLQRITDTNWSLGTISFEYVAVSDVVFSNAFITFRIINGSNKFNIGDKFTIVTTAGAITSSTGPTLGAGTPAANGTWAGIASMPGSSTSETWTITCTLSTAARQEWSVVGSVSGSPPSYWKAGSYPQSVSFHDQRLYFGGSPQFPNRIWGSRAGDYFNFTVGNRDDDGVDLPIASNDYCSITHLVGSSNLIAMTNSTEFSVAGPNNYPISGISSNVIKAHTRHGSNHVRPVHIGQENIFVERGGRKARAISYSVTEDANVAPDVSILAEHLTRDATITDMAFAANPHYIAWLVRTDGRLCSLTHERDLDTTAWAQHSTQGLFEAVAVEPGEMDHVYFVVRREIDGVQRRYVEYFDHIDDGSTTDTCFSDCSVVYQGTSTTSITGLDHLEGCTVTAVADGSVIPDMVVQSGTVSFDYPASMVTVGLKFDTVVELLDPEYGDTSQSTATKARSIVDVVLKFKDTIAARVNGDDSIFKNTPVILDAPVEPFTGDKSVLGMGWTTPSNNRITSDTPTPFTLLAVVIEAQVN